MPTNSKPFVLRVFSGPHDGAEIVLVEEQYTVGRGDACDVMLADEALQEIHVQLLVQGDRLHAVAVEGAPIFIDGRQVDEGTVEPFQFLSVGHTHLAMGPADAVWPDRPLPALVSNAPAETESPVTSGAAVTDAEPEGASLADAADTLGTTSTAGTASARGRRPNASPRTRWLMAGGYLLLLGLGGTVVLMASGKPEAEEVSSFDEKRRELQAIVDRIAPNSTVTITTHDRGFHAEGYVRSRETNDELESALKAMDPTVKTTGIRDSETIARAVRGFLKMRKLGELTVELGEQPGQVVVAGWLASLDEWQKVIDDICTRSGAAEIVDQVTTTVAVAKVAAPVPVTSTTPAQPEPMAAKQKTAPVDRSAQPKPGGLPFRITDVTIGRSRFFTTDTGVKVTENSRFEGHFVKSIDLNRISLIKDGNELVVRLDL